MPPHSECHYSHAMDAWVNVQTTRLFCGHGPIDATTNTTDSTESDNDHNAVVIIEEVPMVPRRHPGGMKRWQCSKPSPRSVNFETEVEIIEIPNVRELPKSQLAEMYMTREEMSKIHAEAWEMVELMNLGIEYDEQNSFSKRGLVDLKTENVERRQKLREQAYKVVFGMQSMGHGTNGPNSKGYSQEIMADLYTQVSAAAKAIAHRTAMYDAMAADKQ